jgi:protocatechuate 3,4-dioxygenase beta subunit
VTHFFNNKRLTTHNFRTNQSIIITMTEATATKRMLSKTIVVFVLTFGKASAQTCPSDVTPRDARGPFYVGGAPLTNRLAPEEQLSDPQNRLVVTGTVFGQDCIPMADALVEPWYAGLPDENGNLYSVAGSSLQYRAQIKTDECGKYEFTSTFPESYSGRPIRHIHYRVSDVQELLVTQLYFEGFILPGYNPDESQISPLNVTAHGARLGKFDIYVAVDGTANATACGISPASANLTTSDPSSAEPSSDSPTSSGARFFSGSPLLSSAATLFLVHLLISS